jgi:hypothetical protein
MSVLARLDLRRPVWALHVLVVGLALHNLVMSQLWHAGLRGSALSVVAAWKDVLLLAALVLVVRARRGQPFSATTSDWLALAFGALVVLYGLIPQSALGGHATHRGVLYAARHDLLPVGAYFLGRGLGLSREELRRLVRTIVATGLVVAIYGLVDVFAVPLDWWRHNGSIGWFQEQLGLGHYNGLSGLPENFVYNAGNDVVYRRLVSTFLSPLATAYMLVAVLLAVAAPRRARWMLAAAPVLLAALLWTHTRAAVFVLAAALALLALASRRWWPVAAAVAVAAAGAIFFVGYQHVAPRTHFTPKERAYQHQTAHAAGKAGNASGNQAETSEHFKTLRHGIHTVLHQPQGYGLGNAGTTAARTAVKVEAGESTYTELGVETGLLGALLFIAWSLALFWRTLWRRPWVGAMLGAMLALGVQTDIIGVPWVAVVVWALAGDALSGARAEPEPAPDQPLRVVLDPETAGLQG